MSLDTYKGAAWAFRTLLRQPQPEIKLKHRGVLALLRRKFTARSFLSLRQRWVRYCAIPKEKRDALDVWWLLTGWI